jgi:hypothetical protein
MNSFSYFCRTSPRGLLMRFTPIFVPAYFFQFTSAKAGITPPKPYAAAAAVLARNVRRVTDPTIARFLRDLM